LLLLLLLTFALRVKNIHDNYIKLYSRMRI